MQKWSKAYTPEANHSLLEVLWGKGGIEVRRGNTGESIVEVTKGSEWGGGVVWWSMVQRGGRGGGGGEAGGAGNWLATKLNVSPTHSALDPLLTRATAAGCGHFQCSCLEWCGTGRQSVSVGWIDELGKQRRWQLHTDPCLTPCYHCRGVFDIEVMKILCNFDE